MADDSVNRRQTGLICAGLALAVIAAYWPLWQCGFVDFDDGDYVLDNHAIQHGLYWQAIWWSFTTFHSGNWHPLTWMSHLLDVQLYGINAIGHHATSLLLHAANAVLLFLLLKRMTRTMWPSAMTAALFALHPMHVESVAWISERKDVLSAFFWMLSVWAWLRFVDESGTQGARLKVFYLASLAFFAMGLMSKPMVLTLPFILLILDYWPLGRWRPPLARLWKEKAPFFVLAIASGVVTMIAQWQGRAVASLIQIPLKTRLENVPLGCARYVGKLVWPNPLAVLYPNRMTWPAWQASLAGVFLTAVTVWVIRRARPQPYLVAGWLWFVTGLAPVNGLIQVGMQSMADRYTYLPSVGLFIMMVWLVRDFGKILERPLAAPLLGMAALAGCLYWTPLQTGYWRNTGTLFTHAVDTTKDNYYACDVLGKFLWVNGQRAAAIHYLDESVAIEPALAKSQNDLGRCLLDAGRLDESLRHLKQAVALRPDEWEGHYNFGNALLAKGRVAEALEQFQSQVNLRPDDAVAQLNFGTVLLSNNLTDDAIPHLEKAAAINPSNAAACFKLGNAYFLKGRVKEAVGQYEKSLHISPDYTAACNNLAWILASSPSAAVRNGAEAVELAKRADRLADGKDPVIAGTLAAACAEVGKFSEAITASARARELAGAQKNAVLVQALDQRLELFRAGLPFRDTPPLSTGGGR